MKVVAIAVAQKQRSDLAASLLSAAEKLGQPPSVVRSTTDGFEVPMDVWEAVRGASEEPVEPPKPPEERKRLRPPVRRADR